MAALYRRKIKGGIFYVDYVYRGRRYRKSTGTSDRKLAELYLKDLEVKIERDNLDLADLDNKSKLLSEFKKEYLEFSKAEKAPNTVLLDDHALRLLEKFLKDIQLRRISVKHADDFKVQRLREVSPSSFNAELRHLKSAFNKAVKWGYLQKNPFSEVKQVKIKGSNFPKFFTKEEVKVVLDRIPEGNFKQLIYFYLYTGCRRNEALNLKWDDIDIVRGRVKFVETKSGKSRVVPFNSQLTEILSRMDRNHERPFPFKSDLVTHKFKKHLRASGIKHFKELNVHSLRHTFASHLVMAGVDLYTVSKLLGHSSIRVTEMYAHLMPDHMKEQVKLLQF